MRSIPKWRRDRRLSEQAAPEARRLYAPYRALTWVGHGALTVMLLSVVAGFISLKMAAGSFDAVMLVWFVTFTGSLAAYPAGEYFVKRLEREFPAALLVEDEQKAMPMSSATGANEGAARSLSVETGTVAAIGDCHLFNDITRTGWPHPDEDSTVFADDDIRILSATCRCGRLYLTVWRRVPRAYFEYLIPLDGSELSWVRNCIYSAPPNVTDKWIAAERTITSLAQSRPTIEYSPFPPEILRWLPPGELLAFTMTPM